MRYFLVAAAVLLAARSARADELYDFAEQDSPEPARDIRETACDVDVRITAGIATIERRSSYTNQRNSPHAFGYELDLPAAAHVIGASLRPDATAADAAAVPVATGFGTELTTDPDIVGPDLAVIEQVGKVDRGIRYRVVSASLPPHAMATLTLRWSIPVTVRSGALRIDLPGRGTNNQVDNCIGTLHASAGPGATVTRLRAGNAVGGAGGMAFELRDGDLALDADLAFARPQPLVWTQQQDLGDGWTAGLVTVVTPPATATVPIARRALLVVDASRSMALVGDAAVSRVIDAIAAALPADTAFDAIVYDRTASRVLGAWQPAGRALPAIHDALAKHVAVNGSDLTAALALAHTATADGARGETMVFAIGDGMLGQLSDSALSDALAAKPSAVDVHAIVLVPAAVGHAPEPPEPALSRLVELYGGSYVVVPVGDLDAALAGVDGWVRPSWQGIAVTGVIAGTLPSLLLAGTGATATLLAHGALPAVTLSTHGPGGISVAATAAGTAAIAAHALADGDRRDAAASGAADAVGDVVPAVGWDSRTRAHLRARFPAVDDHTTLAVLATTGKIARSRREAVAGGGPYTRTAAYTEPAWPGVTPTPVATSSPSAIDRLTLERMFRDNLQPAAYACYQRALSGTPKLGGTVRFDLDLARGEVTSASVAGLGDTAFDACLVDAAYALRPPLPDLAVNSDDETIVHYPLTFEVRTDKGAFIVAGDADSSEPIDIDAVRPGLPGDDRTIHVDARTPLGGLRP